MTDASAAVLAGALGLVGAGIGAGASATVAFLTLKRQQEYERRQRWDDRVASAVLEYARKAASAQGDFERARQILNTKRAGGRVATDDLPELKRRVERCTRSSHELLNTLPPLELAFGSNSMVVTSTTGLRKELIELLDVIQSQLVTQKPDWAVVGRIDATVQMVEIVRQAAVDDTRAALRPSA